MFNKYLQTYRFDHQILTVSRAAIVLRYVKFVVLILILNPGQSHRCVKNLKNTKITEMTINPVDS